jgi:hypothetical protein
MTATYFSNVKHFMVLLRWIYSRKLQNDNLIFVYVRQSHKLTGISAECGFSVRMVLKSEPECFCNLSALKPRASQSLSFHQNYRPQTCFTGLVQKLGSLKIFHFPIRWICYATLALKTQTAHLIATWCIINIAWISGQPTFGVLLVVGVKYHVTKALPPSLKQLKF